MVRQAARRRCRVQRTSRCLTHTPHGPSPDRLARNSIATFGDYPFRTPDYDVWNLRAGFDMGQWSFNAFVQNLDEENYYTGTQENFGASGYRLRPNPRTIGGNVTYRF